MATKVSEKSITCTICLGRYRHPRILPCLHSFCEDCIISYAPKGTQSMTCPLCKDEVEIPGGDVTKFKHDFRLQGQVEDATSYEKVVIGSGPELECNCCDEGQEAVGRCLDCEQFLCQLGMKCHDKIRGLQNHAVFTIEELRSGKIKMKSGEQHHRMCTSHTDEKARYYCHTCHDFICRECTVLDHPKPDHEYTTVVAAAGKYKEEITKKVGDIAKIRDDFKAAEEIALKKAVDVEQESNAALAQLREEAEDLRARIDKMEKERTDEIMRVQEERSAKIGECASEFKNIREHTDNTIETVGEIIENASDEEFLYLFSTLDMKMGNLCDEKTPRKIEVDGAYMVFNQLTTKNIEMGKLEIPEINEWNVAQTLSSSDITDKETGFVTVALHQNGDFVCLLRNKLTPKSKVVILSDSGDLKQSFEVDLGTATENHSKILASDLCIMPDGNIAVFKYYNIDIYQTTGTFEKRIDLQVQRLSQMNRAEVNDMQQSTEPKDVNGSSTEQANESASDLTNAGETNDIPQPSDSGLKDGSAEGTSDSTSNLPASDSKHDAESDVSAKSLASKDDADLGGSLRLIDFRNKQHYLASFDDHQFIGVYDVSSGDLMKRIDVDFRPSRLAVVDTESFLVTGLDIEPESGKICHVNLDGELIKAIPVASESQIAVPPFAVCYDSVTSQIYVSAFKTDHQEGDKSVILQYSSSGLYLGCISTKAKYPYDVRVIGSKKMAVADFENIKILTKS